MTHSCSDYLWIPNLTRKTLNWFTVSQVKTIRPEDEIINRLNVSTFTLPFPGPVQIIVVFGTPPHAWCSAKVSDGENVKVLRYPYLRVIIHDGNIENEKDECSSVRGGRNPDADWLCKPIGLGGLRVGSGFLLRIVARMDCCVRDDWASVW